MIGLKDKKNLAIKTNADHWFADKVIATQQ